MTGLWKAWKAKSRLSTLPTSPLEIRKRGEIPTFPQLRRRVLLSYAAKPGRPRGFAPGPGTE